MDYSISKDRLAELVGALVLQHFPKFNEWDSEVGTKTNGDNTHILYYGYRDKNRIHLIVYARYYVWRKELELNMDLFDKLESVLGEELMTGVIDWFNKEFDQDAETVTY